MAAQERRNIEIQILVACDQNSVGEHATGYRSRYEYGRMEYTCSTRIHAHTVYELEYTVYVQTRAPVLEYGNGIQGTFGVDLAFGMRIRVSGIQVSNYNVAWT